jgi:glycine/D-amino acid oxidase-like deaminating enzyme
VDQQVFPAEADAVVIGAGAFGYSTALHLARAGAGRVVLLDRGTPGDGSSARAAGLFKTVQADEMLTRLSLRSRELVLGFQQATGIDIPVYRSGSILAARTPAHADLIRAEVAHSLGWGVELEIVDATEARRIAPYLDPSGFSLAVHCPGDMYVEEPPELLAAVHAAAEKAGVRIIGNAPVTALQTGDGAIAGVSTPLGDIAAPLVVDAAGAWAKMVGATVGVPVPVVNVRHQFAISNPIAGIDAGMPITRIIDASAYLRPCHDGLMYGSFESGPAAIDPGDGAWGIGDLDLDAAVPRATADDIVGQAPALADATVSELRGGLLTMTPDARFLAGPSPDLRGLWLNTGCNGSGFSFAPAIGEALAAWIMTGEPTMDLSRIDPRRFSGQQFSEDDLRRRGIWQYENYYTPPDVAAASGITGVDASGRA